MNLVNWPVKSHLDSDIADFRRHSTVWVRLRRGYDGASNADGANAVVDVPDIPPPTPRKAYNHHGIVYDSRNMQRRTEALELQQRVISRECPSYAKGYKHRRTLPGNNPIITGNN